MSRRVLQQCTGSETRLAKQYISKWRVTLRHSVDHTHCIFMAE